MLKFLLFLLCPLITFASPLTPTVGDSWGTVLTVFDTTGTPTYVGAPYYRTILEINGNDVTMEYLSDESQQFQYTLNKVNEDFYNDGKTIEERCPTLGGSIKVISFLGNNLEICEYSETVHDYKVVYKVSDEVPGAVIQKSFINPQTDLVEYDHLMVSFSRSN